MLLIVGILVVIGAIIGGYLMEHGHLAVLVQPAELVIIGGAAVGTVLIANSMHTIKGIIAGVMATLKGSHYSKATYLETLKLLYDVFIYARKEGMAKLEAEVEQPEASQVFSKYGHFVKDKLALDFLCDTLRMSISGATQPFDLDQMMELDMEVQAHEAHQPVAALSSMADSLPGLGIVAAVLGVVITMGALGGPPEEIGHKVAAALVGTFLGILLCYGFIGPVAAHMGHGVEERTEFLRCLRVGVIAFLKGSAPILAVEYARRAVPSHVRPRFADMEKACKGG